MKLVKQTFKINVRKKYGDGWQSFTGQKKNTMNGIVEHMKKDLRMFPYEFGIFVLTKQYVEKYKRDLERWELKEIYNLNESEDPMARIKGDDVMRVDMKGDKKKTHPDRVKSMSRLASIRRVMRSNIHQMRKI